jgi:hypothetical protein
MSDARRSFTDARISMFTPCFFHVFM